MSSAIIRYLFLVAYTGYYIDGNVTPNFKIWGGETIEITEAPFVAYLRDAHHTMWCSAVIVHPRFLLSTGHCVARLPLILSNVTVGTADTKSGGSDYEIENAFLHTKFVMDGFDYDMGVIKLKKEMVFSDRVKAIKRDTGIQIKDGDRLSVIGAGQTETNVYNTQLFKLDVPYVNPKTCDDIFKKLLNGSIITDRLMCAGGEEGKGICFGDLGTALVFEQVLVGVATVAGHNKTYCAGGIPDMYMRVAAMRDFIDDVINHNS